MRTIHRAAILVLAAPLAGAPASAASIDDVVKAMGADKVTSIQYSGTGMVYSVGQSYRPNTAWPKFNLVRGTRAYDYAKAILVSDLVVTQGENPPRGGAQQPVIGEQRRAGGVAGDKAWAVAGAFTLSS